MVCMGTSTALLRVHWALHIKGVLPYNGGCCTKGRGLVHRQPEEFIAVFPVHPRSLKAWFVFTFGSVQPHIQDRPYGRVTHLGTKVCPYCGINVGKRGTLFPRRGEKSDNGVCERFVWAFRHTSS